MATNHPTPTPEEVREMRARLSMTQTQFGEYLRCSLRAVQQWESGERTMHPGLWELATTKEALRHVRT